MLKLLLLLLALHCFHIQGLAGNWKTVGTLLEFLHFTFSISLTYASFSPVSSAAGQGGLPSSRETATLSDSYLGDVSGNVLKAEAWLRAHVLSRYPASGTSTIVVGDTISCTGDQEPKLGLVLPSLKNIHHSLTRWGLERDIKVSVSLSQDCLTSGSDVGAVRSVLKFLESVNSTHIVDSAPLKSSPLPVETSKFGSLSLSWLLGGKPMTMSRKLSSVESDSKLVKPYPARPSPLPEIPRGTPLHSSVGFSIPAHIAKSPHPAPSGSRLTSPPPLPPLPPLTFPFAPEQPPVFVPVMPPLAFTLPPCAPPADDGRFGSAPSSGTAERGRQRLWCVAKPTVPEDTLQEAMDYACGEGGGDCGEIMPSGSCYYPNTVIAHASYAFNSYWQKNKGNGGTCSFGGTAMLINADPKRTTSAEKWIALLLWLGKIKSSSNVGARYDFNTAITERIDGRVLGMLMY
ncbi:hypothetical protein CRG98_034848 [Punica granatum]|uniref:glucan endo-1,3-beta-D-glucosidase n=1 Tax=Punica granatum TaxID=22663 RepID=A0A2I0IMK2_PUNGR|nr:hypothetical protein CRG98_034848 [Punica granatum]